jgi:hypothetical protein
VIEGGESFNTTTTDVFGVVVEEEETDEGAEIIDFGAEAIDFGAKTDCNGAVAVVI